MVRGWALATLIVAAFAWPATGQAQVPAGAPIVVLPTELLAASGERVINREERRRALDRLPSSPHFEAARLADGDRFFNLGYAYWLDRDPRATIYWLREAVRRNPGDGDAHFILGAALRQTGATADATREREPATRLSSKYAGWEARAAAGDPVPRGRERLAGDLTPSAG